MELKIGTWDCPALCMYPCVGSGWGYFGGVGGGGVGVGGGDGSKAAEVMRSPSLLSLLITVA